MNILVLNSGSSSLKYQLFDMARQANRLARGQVDRIGLSGAFIRHEGSDGPVTKIEQPFPDHGVALQTVLKMVTPAQTGAAAQTLKVDGIGHRVVHGGEAFQQSVLVNDEVIEVLKAHARLAPLHNPPNIVGIEHCRQLLPEVPNVAVFDTAVHQSMPPKAYLYGLPLELYEQHGIRRYGVHGTSHGYVAREAARLLGQPFEDVKIITCHLGNGASITAFQAGQSIDTSMGFTPLEGVMMGTRSGDLDPAIVPYLVEVVGFDLAAVKELLNTKSGLKGLCGQSDMRDIMAEAGQGNPQAQTAIEVFVYRIQKYIGAYVAALNGLEAIVFTAGIGEHSPVLRQKILTAFDYLGVKVDEAKNLANQPIFSAQDSRVYAMTIPTNEELVIAEETYQIIAPDQRQRG
jgi:acetate kinase